MIINKRKYGDVCPWCNELTRQMNAPHARKTLKIAASMFLRSHRLFAGTANRIIRPGTSHNDLRTWINQK
jgi:hypothetical protein